MIDTDLAERRLRECTHLAAQFAHTLHPDRTPPAVAAQHDPHTSPGEYHRHHHTVALRTTGFLDDPATPPEVIRSILAHEVGHWSDPILGRRVATQLTGFSVFLTGGLVVLPAVTLLHHTQPLASTTTALAMLACVAAAVLIYSGTGWSGELYAADRAADLVGVHTAAAACATAAHPGARIAQLTALYTHPPPDSYRARRLTRRATPGGPHR